MILTLYRKSASKNRNENKKNNSTIDSLSHDLFKTCFLYNQSYLLVVHGRSEEALRYLEVLYFTY